MRLSNDGIVSERTTGNMIPDEAGTKKLQHVEAQATMDTRSQFTLSHGVPSGGQQSGTS
jgi:hypothetical protein